MADHGRCFNAEPLQRFMEKMRLSYGVPNGPPRPRTVPVSRPVEYDYAIALRGHVDDAAQFIILDHRSISVQQYQRRPFPAFDVVQTNTVNIQKAALGWIRLFSFVR